MQWVYVALSSNFVACLAFSLWERGYKRYRRSRRLRTASVRTRIAPKSPAAREQVTFPWLSLRIVGSTGWAEILQNNPFDLVERDLVVAAIVKLGGPEVTKRPDFTHKRTNHELRRSCERYWVRP
jgi:hypothetical protein